MLSIYIARTEWTDPDTRPTHRWTFGDPLSECLRLTEQTHLTDTFPTLSNRWVTWDMKTILCLVDHSIVVTYMLSLVSALDTTWREADTSGFVSYLQWHPCGNEQEHTQDSLQLLHIDLQTCWVFPRNTGTLPCHSCFPWHATADSQQVCRCIRALERATNRKCRINVITQEVPYLTRFLQSLNVFKRKYMENSSLTMNSTPTFFDPASLSGAFG